MFAKSQPLDARVMFFSLGGAFSLSLAVAYYNVSECTSRLMHFCSDDSPKLDTCTVLGKDSHLTTIFREYEGSSVVDG